MTPAALRLSAAKECRALLPTWAACIAVIALPALFGYRSLVPLAVLTYGVGAVALGAQSMGHEYAHRTVGLLLSQPAGRRSLYLIKLAVLTPMLAALAALTFVAVVPEMTTATELGLLAVRGGALVMLAALFLAPCFTMLCRSGIAGLVFTMSVPGMLMFLPGGLYFGLMLALWALVASWHLFDRLEAIEGPGRDLHLPRWMARDRGGRTSRRGALVQLIFKELRLQQMAFALAAVCALTVAAVMVRRYLDPRVSADLVVAIITLYTAALPLLIGALASAEERNLATREWQLLMPMAASTQWVVKVGVVISLALVLALALPALMTWLAGGGPHVSQWPWFATAAVVLASAGLYVSSLNSSGIRALLLAMATVLGASVAAEWIVRRLLLPNPARLPVRWDGDVVVPAAAIVLSALLLYFAHLNHRSSERPRTQLRRQAGWIGGLMVLELSLLVAAGVR